MRCLIRVQIPVEAGNGMISEGRLAPMMQGILEALKPESSYFYAENGCRTCMFVVDIADPAQIPALTEPFFLALQARVDVLPVMTADDLMRAGPAIEKAVQAWAPHRQPALTR